MGSGSVGFRVGFTPPAGVVVVAVAVVFVFFFCCQSGSEAWVHIDVAPAGRLWTRNCSYTP